MSVARSGGEEVMTNFMTQTVNTLGVPVIAVGTLSARKRLGADFAVARRNIGPRPWHRFKEDSPDWQLFCSTLWGYQYTRQVLPYGQDLPAVHELWDVSQGVIDLAVKAYMLAQTRAIGGTERITAGLIRSVARDHFGMVARYIQALRRGKINEIAKYEDLLPLDVDSALAAERARRGEPVDEVAVARADAVGDLTDWLQRAGMSPQQAQAAASIAVAELGPGAGSLYVRAMDLARIVRVSEPAPAQTDAVASSLDSTRTVADSGADDNEPAQPIEMVDPPLGHPDTPRNEAAADDRGPVLRKARTPRERLEDFQAAGLVATDKAYE